MKKHIYLILLFIGIICAETLFEVKDASNNKVLDVSTDGLRVMNQGDTLMVIGSEGIKVFIEQDATKALSRKFSVTTTSAKGTKAQNKVFEIATDEGATFYNPSDNSDEILSISKGNIIANVNPTLNRDFIVNDQASAKGGGNLMKISNEGTFEVVNDSTMLWYKQKNAFRVGHVLVNSDSEVGQASFASGRRTTASGDFSSALGYASTASGTSSFSTGNQTTSSGNYSIAMGRYSTASGLGSVAIGESNSSQGSNSVAMGGGTTASGSNSICAGSSTAALGPYSSAFGDWSVASGASSSTIGSGCKSQGDYSFATGQGVYAQSYCSSALGRYNILRGDSISWISTDPLFVVGNGSTTSSRSNAFEVKKNGDAKISGSLGINTDPVNNYGLSVTDSFIGILGSANTSTGTSTFGVYGQASGGSSTNYGIYGQAFGTGSYAGYFAGDINVTGIVVKSKDVVKIDHPLDPENKYLSHSNVISDDMTSVYNGNVVLDGNGKAGIQLPEWFEKLNKDYKYQLTAIGAPGPNLYISKEISNNNFEISGGVSGMKVSWQVTGIRNDNFAKNNPIKIETDKKENEKGLYMHPESFGLSKEKGIDYQVNKVLPEATSK